MSQMCVRFPPQLTHHRIHGKQESKALTIFQTYLYMRISPFWDGSGPPKNMETENPVTSMTVFMNSCM